MKRGYICSKRHYISDFHLYYRNLNYGFSVMVFLLNIYELSTQRRRYYFILY